MKLRIKSITLLALTTVCAAFMVIAGPRVNSASRHSREAVLKTDLRTIRDAIDNYTLDKHEPPHSLQDLVDAGYLRKIPLDPITYKPDWAPDFGEPVLGDPVLSPGLKAKGLIDIHSNSNRASLDGTKYSEW